MAAVVSQVPLACVEATEHHFRGDTALATTSPHPRGAHSAGGFNQATRKGSLFVLAAIPECCLFLQKTQEKCIRYLMPVQSDRFQP